MISHPHQDHFGEIKNIDKNIPIFCGKATKEIIKTTAYNQSFEISRIKELANFAPRYEKELLSLIGRFVDLIVPFRAKGYYHPNFNGSFSIKAVLPAMFPNDDELDYKKLGSVQNGGDAMDTFANLHLLRDKSKRDEIRKDLLAYCRLDTLAMVRICKKLKGIVDK